MQILIVSPDPSLREEVEAALENFRGPSPTIRLADGPSQGVEVARNRRPDLVLVEMQEGVEELARFAREMALQAPGVMIAAAYRPGSLGPGVSEASVIVQGVRSGVSDFLRRPLSSQEFSQLLERAAEHDEGEKVVERGLLVSVSSTKGGVGKSTLAVNLACQLARRAPGRVLLVDASLQLGVCSSMLDLEPRTTLLDALRELDRLDATLLREMALRHDCGLHLLAAPRDPLDAARLGDEELARILGVARRAYDYVVVDTYPLLESVVLAVLDLSDLVYLLFQGNVPGVLGQVGYLRALEKLGVEVARQRLVLSRNHPGYSGELSRGDIEEKLGRGLDHVLPYQRQILASVNSGEPHVLHARGFRGYAKALRNLAAEVVRHRQEGKASGSEPTPGSESDANLLAGAATADPKERLSSAPTLDSPLERGSPDA